MNFLSKLNTSRKIILEMLDIRGFDTEKYKTFTINEIDIMFREIDKKITYEMTPLDMKCKHKSKDTHIYIKYILSTKLRTSNLKELVSDLTEHILEEGDSVVIIVKDKINNMENFDAILDSFYNVNNNFIQLFCIENLLVNITKHVLVPSLTILSDEEKINTLKKFNLDNYEKFPIILKSDPQAKFCGVKNGDLVEITRPSETSGIYKSYRYCL